MEGTRKARAATGDGAGRDSDAADAQQDEGAQDGGVAAAEASSNETGPDRLESLQSEMSVLQDRHLRLAAEYDNYRKRSERERTESWGKAQAELVKRLLDVLDDLQRVAQFDEATTTVHALHEGVELVEKKMRSALESAGLTTIDAEGQRFDPGTMEALMTVPAASAEEDEHVADVFQKGYRFQNNLVRPARVRVKKYEG
jgi:molecular chaperone GrpE